MEQTSQRDAMYLSPPDLPLAPSARRHALAALGFLGVTAALHGGCRGGDSSSNSATSADIPSGGATCSAVPEETDGPYPADGSTASSASYNVLALSGIVRSDIRSSIGSSTVMDGVPLTLSITLTDAQNSCAALPGYAIYIWHCSQQGEYSVYTEQSIAANYLRGVQETDASGSVTFTTIVPACYAGRMPHIHVEIYPSLAVATTAANKVRTTQLAFPTETLRTIYQAHSGYSSSVTNLASISFATDNVFSDGTDLEMVTLQVNDATGGYTAAITIPMAA